jgi:hypothetical protein
MRPCWPSPGRSQRRHLAWCRSRLRCVWSFRRNRSRCYPVEQCSPWAGRFRLPLIVAYENGLYHHLEDSRAKREVSEGSGLLRPSLRIGPTGRIFTRAAYRQIPGLFPHMASLSSDARASAVPVDQDFFTRAYPNIVTHDDSPVVDAVISAALCMSPCRSDYVIGRLFTGRVACSL